MNQVQKGGAPPMIESYLDGEKVLIRPFLDQAYWKEDWHQAIVKFFQPGMHHYFWANPSMGKTSVMVSLMQTLINQELTPGRKWMFLTNQFFSYQDEEGNVRTSYPKNVIHYNSLKELLSKIKEYKEQGFDVAVVFDDLDRFFIDSGNVLSKKKAKIDPVSEAIRNIIANRRKLGIMVFSASSDDYADFEEGRNRRCSSDIMWGACHEADNELSQNAKMSFPVRDYWYGFPVDNCNVLIPRTSWAYEHFEKKKGFFFDREGAAVIKIGEGFDIAGMFAQFGQTATTDIWDLVSKYLEAPPETSTSKSAIDRDAEIAMRLKNMGLTDESIEWALCVPKTTLRRHVEKCGEVWGISDKQPFLFKKVKASERSQELSEGREETPETPS